MLRALQPLVDLVLLKDKAIVNVICDAAEPNDSDSLAFALLAIHEDAGQTISLINARVGHEVAAAPALATLFRTNRWSLALVRC